jgi:outer membrane protein assembly factor BamB
MKSISRSTIVLVAGLIIVGYFGGTTRSLSQTANALRQTSEPVVTSAADIRRTGLFTTRGLHRFTGVAWKTPKLFSIEEKRSALYEDDIDIQSFLYLNYFVSAPLAANNTIYFSLYNGHGFLGAFDARTGQLRWSIERKEGMISPPVIVGNTAYVGAGARTVRSVDVATGQETGRFTAEAPAKLGVLNKLRGDRYAPSPTVAADLVLLGGAEGRFLAMNRSLTELKWSVEVGGTVGTAAVAGNTAFVGTTLGFLHAIDLANGKEKWKLKAKAPWPLATDDSVFFAENQTVHAINASTGQENWRTRVGATVGTPLAIAYGIIYFAGFESDVYAVDAGSGKAIWRFKTADSCSAPVLADGVVYESCTDHLFAIDAKSGSKLWEFAEKKLTMLAPAVSDNMLHVITEEGFLLALR